MTPTPRIGMDWRNIQNLIPDFASNSRHSCSQLHRLANHRRYLCNHHYSPFPRCCSLICHVSVNEETPVNSRFERLLALKMSCVATRHQTRAPARPASGSPLATTQANASPNGGIATRHPRTDAYPTQAMLARSVSEPEGHRIHSAAQTRHPNTPSLDAIYTLQLVPDIEGCCARARRSTITRCHRCECQRTVERARLVVLPPIG
jgi:hypothetical protein